MDNFKYQNLYHLNSEFLEKYKQFDESSQFLSPEMFKKISKSYLNDYSKKLKVLDFNSKFELKIALKEKKNLRKKILLDYKIRKKKQAEKRKSLLTAKQREKTQDIEASRKNKNELSKEGSKRFTKWLRHLVNRKKKCE